MESTSNASSDGGGREGAPVTEQIRQGTQQVVQGTQQAVSQVAEGARQQAQSLLERQKSQTTQTLHQVHSALSQTGQTLRDQNQAAAAGLVEGTAGKLDGICQYLEGHDVGQLVGDAEDFARANTPIFLGGAFALGILAARFLKSSTPKRVSAYSSGYGPGRGINQQPGSYGSYRDYSGDSYSDNPTPRYRAPASYSGISETVKRSQIGGGRSRNTEGSARDSFEESDFEKIKGVTDGSTV